MKGIISRFGLLPVLDRVLSLNLLLKVCTVASILKERVSHRAQGTGNKEHILANLLLLTRQQQMLSFIEMKVF
jgi:hypothetical protein